MKSIKNDQALKIAIGTIIGTVISSIIIGVFMYTLIIRDNQNEIRHLKEGMTSFKDVKVSSEVLHAEVDNIKGNLHETQKSLKALMLAIASLLPNIDLKLFSTLSDSLTTDQATSVAKEIKKRSQFIQNIDNYNNKVRAQKAMEFLNDIEKYNLSKFAEMTLVKELFKTQYAVGGEEEEVEQ